MARLLLVSIFCIAIIFSDAAKLDHKKKGQSSPADAHAPQDKYNDIPPSDLPSMENPNEKPMETQSTEAPHDDFTEANADTELGNDMGPSPPKPFSKPKISAVPKDDNIVPNKPATSLKMQPTKKGSQHPSGGKLNFGSAVKIMATAQAGIDFPAYSMDNMPQTSFSCDQQQYPGYYADPEAQCQMFHFCTFKVVGMNTVPTSFLCPNYTIFDQRTLTCNWFYQVDCSQAVNFYEKINSRLYQTALPLIDDEPETNSHHEPAAMGPTKIKHPVNSKKPKKEKEEESDQSQEN